MSQPTPEQAARQLAIHRYLITAGSQDVHDALAEEAPYANWVEVVPTPEDLGTPQTTTWLVTVFAVDNDAFLTVLGSEEHAKVLTRLLGSGRPGAWTLSWGPWTDPATDSLNGHGRR